MLDDVRGAAYILPMSQIPDNTPIIIGIGQSVDQVPTDLLSAASHADMAGKAALAALKDAGISEAEIDHIACTRIFSDSSPAYACPFGRADKFPLAVAARIGTKPVTSLYDSIGGQTPQTLVAECAEGLLSGIYETALIAGGEALANMRAGQRAGLTLDWSETHEGACEDRGQFHGPMIINATEINHGMHEPIMYYGMMETARRIAQGDSAQVYQDKMAALLAPMSDVATRNPYAMFPKEYSAAELAEITTDNRPIVSPYTKYIVAKDGVNQGAALIMTTVGKAKALGVDPAKWVFLHGHGQSSEWLMLERDNIAKSNAMEAAFRSALSQADMTANEIKHLDLYSCFPIVVSLAKDALGIEDNDLRPLTQTGGLPFFGGPGNNYTLHGIASLIETLRNNPDDMGLAYGNGGWMSKHAIGIYSMRPPVKPWEPSREDWQDSFPLPAYTDIADGPAKIESYIVRYKRGAAIGAIIIGRLDRSSERFYAKLETADEDILARLAQGELTDNPILVTGGKGGNSFTFA